MLTSFEHVERGRPAVSPTFETGISGARPLGEAGPHPADEAGSHPAEAIRRRAPLVHCITNSVTIQWMANGLLAAGARPIMVLDKAESADMARHADALLLNFGTWDPEQQQSMLAAAAAANEADIPVVLDPVGAGGLVKRTEAALELLRTRRVHIIRGNGGEIVGLAGTAGMTRGVDSDVDPGRSVVVETAARQLARRYDCLVIATGRHDLVTDGEATWIIRGGHPILQDVVGSGCLVGALVAAAAAAFGTEPRRMARVLLWCKAAGEVAAARTAAAGPGSFAAAFLDVLAAPERLPAGRISRPLTELLGVYVIVDGATPPELVEKLVGAGVRAVQLRDKNMSLGELLRAAKSLRDVCRAHGAMFFVNDHVDVALAVGADGVHIGQADMPLAAVRALLGPDKLIGVSVSTVAEAEAAARDGADYLGTGPIFETPTKPDAAPLGPKVLTDIRASVSTPQVAIAGIRPDRVAPVIEAGADGVAVISAVLRADDPVRSAQQLLDAVEQARRS